MAGRWRSAGFIPLTNASDVTGVPVLVKIPLVGWLFRHDARRTSRSELVIFITPHVVVPPG